MQGQSPNRRSWSANDPKSMHYSNGSTPTISPANVRHMTKPWLPTSRQIEALSGRMRYDAVCRQKGMFQVRMSSVAGRTFGFLRKGVMPLVAILITPRPRLKVAIGEKFGRKTDLQNLTVTAKERTIAVCDGQRQLDGHERQPARGPAQGRVLRRFLATAAADAWRTCWLRTGPLLAAADDHPNSAGRMLRHVHAET